MCCASGSQAPGRHHVGTPGLREGETDRVLEFLQEQVGDGARLNGLQVFRFN